MNHHLSFAKINILSENILEVIINPNVEISLEMSEEYDDLLSTTFSQDFAILVNKINEYDFSFEAKLSMASHEKLKAIAVITYNNDSKTSVEEVAAMRQRDGWNLKVFDGLNLGRQEALDWLNNELGIVALDN
jgi:hypothetical protein